MERRMPRVGPCSVEGCERPIRARLLCSPHYERKRAGRDISSAPLKVVKIKMVEVPDFMDCASCARVLPKSMYAISSERGTVRLSCRFCVKLKNHGLSMRRYTDMLFSQSGLCATCSSQLINPSIDHNHRCCPGVYSCGKCVRGILCRNCNSALGLAGDSAETVRNMLAYLEGEAK